MLSAVTLRYSGVGPAGAYGVLIELVKNIDVGAWTTLGWVSKEPTLHRPCSARCPTLIQSHNHFGRGNAPVHRRITRIAFATGKKTMSLRSSRDKVNRDAHTAPSPRI
jgi:hypothetical protein